MRSLLAAAVLACGPAVAGELRPVSDMAAAPWRSLARVVVAGETRCSGFVVSPTQVLTAGHCLYSARLGGVVPASAVHVQVGYHMGRMTEHRVVAEHGIVHGYDPRRGLAVTGLDVAVLRLAVPLAAVPLPLAAPETGWTAGWVLGVGEKNAVAVAGYPRQRPEVVGADTDCRLRGTIRDQGGHSLLVHDCAGKEGTSGGPLLQRVGDGVWRVIGVHVAINAERREGYAVPASILEALIR